MEENKKSYSQDHESSNKKGTMIMDHVKNKDKKKD